jgi:DNA-binding response OmpR family regulator
VRVDSEVDRGTRFVVTIPVGKDHLPADRIDATRTLTSTASRAEAYVEEALRWLPDAPRGAAQRSSAVEHAVGPQSDRFRASRLPSATHAARILLVDDNTDMREYVQRLLAQAGYEVDTAADGRAALDAARGCKPDLVLSDVMMPGLDGFGLLRELRDDPELRDVPLVLLSARAGEEARVEGMQAGADDYLIKPFSARKLLARVDAQLNMAEFRRKSTAALRESESRFRALVLATSDVSYSMNADWTEMRYLNGRDFIPARALRRARRRQRGLDLLPRNSDRR